jgi:prephenate dehydratase
MPNASKIRIITQGIPGSFHFEAANNYFKNETLDFVSADSFIELATGYVQDNTIDYGVMAIENSIAGSIIKNYKILRENRFRIIGEIYQPIIHNLMAVKGQSIKDIKEVRSHPMAINQCLNFLKAHNIHKYVTTIDTAHSAKVISENQEKGVAAIASIESASIYNLDIIAPSIQSSTINYTRFFIFQRDEAAIPVGHFNKASIYLRTTHQKGSLLKVLQVIYKYDINLSKLQSFPVLDNFNKYYFHLDLEFETTEQYVQVIPELQKLTQELDVLGVYNNGISAMLT